VRCEPLRLASVPNTYQPTEREEWLTGVDWGWFRSDSFEYAYVARKYSLNYRNSVVKWLSRQADDRQHAPSLDTRRSCQQSQCDELASNYISAIGCLISLPQGRENSIAAKSEGQDQSSVSSKFEEGDVKSFHYGKSRLQEWKQGAGKSKSWKKGPTLKRCGYHKSVPYFEMPNISNHE
jgi:hypothetical protein